MDKRPEYYKCRFCYTFSKNLAWIKEHEKICHYNPVNKQCGSCKNRVMHNNNGIYEYVCQKGWQVHKIHKLCKDWVKSPAVDLTARANKPEYE